MDDPLAASGFVLCVLAALACANGLVVAWKTRRGRGKAS
jgi:hypothetical protein